MNSLNCYQKCISNKIISINSFKLFNRFPLIIYLVLTGLTFIIKLYKLENLHRYGFNI